MSGIPWAEKHRPQTLEEVVGHEAAVSRLQALAGGGGGGAPHLLLSGPPGVGKTSALHCLARQLLQDNYKLALLELNASNERGIDVVRNKIKMFAQQKVSTHTNCIVIVVISFTTLHFYVSTLTCYV